MPVLLLDLGGRGGQVVGQEVQAGVDNTSFISHIRVDLILWNRCNQFLVGHHLIINFRKCVLMVRDTNILQSREFSGFRYFV